MEVPMKKHLLVIFPFVFMACQDSSSVSAIDGSDSKGSEDYSASGKKGFFVQAKYPENIAEPIIDSIAIVPRMDMALERFGIDGLAFDVHVVSSISQYNERVHEFIQKTEYANGYAPFLSAIPDSNVYSFAPPGTELHVAECRYYLLGYTAGQQPYAYVVTRIAKDSIDMVSIERSPKDGFSCRFDNAMLYSGFLIEDCGDSVVPEKDFVVRWSSVESPLWTCDDPNQGGNFVDYELDQPEEPSCTIICRGGGEWESRCDTTCPE